MKKRDLLISVAIPLLTGVFATLLSGEGMAFFVNLNKPPLTPPAWVFPVVWTLLYTMMGIAAYLVTMTDGDCVDEALLFYGIQLLVNFFWPIFFFGFGWYLVSFLWLVLLWVLVFIMIRRFYNISKLAGILQIPYLIWLTFAAYLNLGVWILN